MNVYITSKEELTKVVYQAVKKVFDEELPSAVRKASRKAWITTNELMELTGWQGELYNT
jgi:hypothetical protein